MRCQASYPVPVTGLVNHIVRGSEVFVFGSNHLFHSSLVLLQTALLKHLQRGPP